MAKKLKHISREELQASQKKLEEMMSKDPLGKQQLEKLAKLEKSAKKRGRGKD